MIKFGPIINNRFLKTFDNHSNPFLRLQFVINSLAQKSGKYVKLADMVPGDEAT